MACGSSHAESAASAAEDAIPDLADGGQSGSHNPDNGSNDGAGLDDGVEHEAEAPHGQDETLAVYELLELETNFAMEACRSLELRDTVSIGSTSGVPGMRESPGLTGSVAAPDLLVGDAVEIEGTAETVVDACTLPALTYVEGRVSARHRVQDHGNRVIDTPVTLRGPAHRFDSLTIAAGGRLQVTAPTYIVADEIRLSGDAGLADYATDVRIFADRIVIEGSATLRGRVVANRAEIHDDAVVTGSILANEAVADGRARVAWATILAAAGFHHSCREFSRADIDLHRVYLVPHERLAAGEITAAAVALGIDELRPFLQGVTGRVGNPADYEALLASPDFRWIGHFLHTGNSVHLNGDNELFIGFYGPQTDAGLVAFANGYQEARLDYVARMDETSMFAGTDARMTPELLRVANGLCEDPYVFASHPDVMPLDGVGLN